MPGPPARTSRGAEAGALGISGKAPGAHSITGPPSSGIFDLSGSWRFNGHLGLNVSVNNLADRRYFTKRPEFYPGPGVWPSDGRSIVASLRLAL